jgi:hypothetical protein
VCTCAVCLGGHDPRPAPDHRVAERGRLRTHTLPLVTRMKTFSEAQWRKNQRLVSTVKIGDVVWLPVTRGAGEIHVPALAIPGNLVPAEFLGIAAKKREPGTVAYFFAIGGAPDGSVSL